MLQKLENMENNIKNIITSINTSLEKSSDKLIDLVMRNNKEKEDVLYEIVNLYHDDIINQRRRLLESGMVLLNSIENAKKKHLTTREMENLLDDLNKDLELLVS